MFKTYGHIKTRLDEFKPRLYKVGTWKGYFYPQDYLIQWSPKDIDNSRKAERPFLTINKLSNVYKQAQCNENKFYNDLINNLLP